MKSQFTFFLILATLLVSCEQKPLFELLEAEQTGISFVNAVEETDSLHILNFEYLYNGAGVGIMDLDNDGFQDIVFTGNQVSPRVYLNEGDFHFRDISSRFDGLDEGQWYSGVSWVDINQDGWKDVYLTCTAYSDSASRKNKFYINLGPGDNGELRFEDMAEDYGIDDDSYTVQAAFFDYDLDGDLDLYLLNNYVIERLSASYRPRINNGTAESNDDLYRNNGDGTFSNVSLEAGIVYEGFGLGLALGDVNKDGYPDIYVSNDYVSNDLLYINQGDGTFRNMIADYMSYQTRSSMGNDMADINNDGNPDMFTLDMLPEYYHKRKQTLNGFGYIYYANDAKFGYEHQYVRNMLHMHNGFVNGKMIPYSEVGQMLGIFQTEWSWSPLFADYDNDGDKDLLIANGYPSDMTDKDWARYKAKVYGSLASDRHMIARIPAVKSYNFAFENRGPEGFANLSKEWFDPLHSFSYGAAFADLDNDGDLDYVTNNLNDPPFIYRNRTVEKDRENRNYIRLSLKGSGKNNFAFGAKIELWSGENYQFQEHFLSRGYVSSVDPVVHFGLGSRTVIDSLKVSWPGDTAFILLRDLPVNQLIEMKQEEASLFGPYESPRKEEFLFTKMEGILSYRHQQNDFVESSHDQVIVPHKFSQIGPCIAKGDLDGDGLEDLIIGATNTLPTSVFLKKENGFERTILRGLDKRPEFSESGFAIFDSDNDGDNDVVALAGGYENLEGNYFHYLYENTCQGFVRKELPLPPFPASVVRPMDFDHDGDIDLFIGARIKQNAFPFAPFSWILINDQGNFRKELAIYYDLGMVTDAVWSDYNGDGWEDLIVAREWNSIMLLENRNGKKILEQEFTELENKHGMWFSINQGDFDQDGDPDYILGNLGDNHRFNVSEQHPMKVYALDLDMNGTLDPISTAFWRDQYDIMTEYPINYYDELATQSNYFLKKYTSYTQFSHASIPTMFDTTILKRVQHTLYINSTSSYILWNESGYFRWEKLPHQAQVSPLKKSIIRDFNGDGYPDALLTGNDHSFDIGTGYYDACKGILLLSRDDQPLKDTRTSSQTGLVLHGMVESLLYLDGENPLIVAGINRDSVVTYSVNR